MLDNVIPLIIEYAMNINEANATEIKLKTEVQKERIEIKIIDNGDGMLEKDLKKKGLGIHCSIAST